MNTTRMIKKGPVSVEASPEVAPEGGITGASTLSMTAPDSNRIRPAGMRTEGSRSNGSKASGSTSVKFVGDESGLSTYLREIGHNTNLTLAQEAELARRIRSGDKVALHTLVQANLKFVVAVCRNYQYQGLPMGDLISEGNLGLIRAAKRFDETLNFKFISYAVWWIRQAILSALADQSRVINIPPSRVGVIHKMGKTTVKLEQRLGRSPTAAELSEEMGMAVNDIHECLQLSSTPVSLQAPVRDGEDGRVEDMLVDQGAESPDKSTVAFTLRQEMEGVLESLDEREEKVMRLYYGIGLETTYTLEEIAQRFELTRERVRQIKESALKRLRHPSRISKLARFKG